MSSRTCALWLLLVACSKAPDLAEDSAPPTSEPSEVLTEQAPEPEPEEPDPEPEPTCDDPLPVYADGEHTRDICPDHLGDLTVLDLSDEWAPFLFSEDPSLGDVGMQPYRSVFVALADERLDDVPDELDKEPYLELFGIPPSFRVLQERLADEERHACHETVDTSALSELAYTLRPWAPTREAQQDRARTVRYLRHRLARAARELGVSEDDLSTHETWGPHHERARRLGIVHDAINATQAMLRCEGLITRRIRVEEGVFDWRTAGALAKYQRHHLIVSGGALDGPTKTALAEDSRVQDWQSTLRTLRERVVDATGLLEDGSAGHTWGDVLGVSLDAPEFRFDSGQPAAENPAPDAVSPATEAAARALGWTGPAETLASLTRLRARGHQHVAVALPSLPAYYTGTMDLRAEVDRGDVHYAYPYTSEGTRRGQRIEARPIVTLYAQTASGDVALVRWPTTIGGWKPERAPGGGTALKYKESYVGERVWRDVIAAPAWLPPPSTPDDDLLRRVNGRLVPNYGLFGPGYRSAYGLAMLMHHRVLDPLDPDADPASPEAQPRFYDQGIRVHGSVSYRSITRGTSHGCHRLYNHLAVRLASFVLRHRRFTRHGSITVRYRRNVRGINFRIRSRGYRYELTPPVPVIVREGRVRGGVREPVRGYRLLPEHLARQAQAEAAEDG
ncbi:MAG: hypothetical protein AAGE52_00805 [Myxococcota bacterium]